MERKIRIFLLMFLILLSGKDYAQETVTFAVKDGQELKMTIYEAKYDIKQPETIIYVFGGGFFKGSREDSLSVDYCRKMQERGFTTIAIDYRLGMKDNKDKGMKFVKAMQKSIDMAVEDLSSAVAYIVRNADRWDVDPERIVTTGSSAGAITVLQTDYCLANGMDVTKELPEGFRFAGVMAYAGAIFSHNGKVKYRQHEPAPTMMYHGTKDRVVTYGQIELFNLGLYGGKALFKVFKRNSYPVKMVRCEGLAHDVAMFGNKYVDDAVYFIEHWVRRGEQWTTDETFKDFNYQSPEGWAISRQELYK